MRVQQRMGIDAGPVEGAEPGITANFLVMASILSVVVPTALLLAAAGVILALLR